MTEPDRRVGVFFDKLTNWRAELEALRAILLDSGLREEFKWRSPVYTFGGSNVAILWGFKDHAALGFFKGVLFNDPQGLLVAPGENSRSSRMVTFTDAAQVAERADALRALIREGIAVESAGQKVDFAKDDLDYPPELIDRLDADADFRTAFEALTPGRRRSHVLHISQAKQSATRVARIDRAAPRILAGKGFNER